MRSRHAFGWNQPAVHSLQSTGGQPAPVGKGGSDADQWDWLRWGNEAAAIENWRRSALTREEPAKRKEGIGGYFTHGLFQPQPRA